MSAHRKPKIENQKSAEGYTVLARRYRPQQFGDIVGQEAVARALVNAIQSNRVAHAYLFTGARGVGKTSTARILAKALNCAKGPTATPCDACEICLSIASGEDVDVLEIDGASNNGVEQVRQLRQNVQYRPSRSRCKIYIIDEVHMLTPAAFNALLKTLEEPPAHVKFIFATTEVQKIPVTILSRCQRFDFAGIGTARIVDRLRQIVADEGMRADDEALELIARRAGGSMRDAQSLLDQLLAFGGDPLTTEQIHRLLGTADDDRVVALATAVLEHDAKRALELLAEAAGEGLNVGELLDQLMDYWRDLMVVNCAGPEGRDLSVSSRHREILARQASAVSVDTIMAGLDILAATKARLRGSQHGRVLIEMALVRLGRLEDLVSLAQLAQWLGQPRGPKIEDRGSKIEGSKVGQGSTDSRARTAERRPSAGAEVPPSRSSILDPRSSTVPTSLTTETLPQVWQEVLAQVGPILRSHLEKAEGVAISGPNTLVIRFGARYNLQRDHCQEPTSVARTEEVLRKFTGKAWSLRIESGSRDTAVAPAQAADAENSQSRYRRQRTEAVHEPLVKRAIERLGAQVVQVDEGFGSAPTEAAERLETAEDMES
ncbi:MAG TPA: DNA polymerase III subunit gamma/tau [Gemmataceae bacterium]|jgi:DNA polymerase-3 subunit gamma/tau|nr:DNA polymerase III subunit gamma/tau [Gemmataceae bacterium]